VSEEAHGGGSDELGAQDDPDSRASMRKVAERADVAISSVSRVLSGHPDVSDKMRIRVMAAVAELEYEPDFLAQSLRRGLTLSVGFVLSDISNPLLADIVLGAETELRSAGYSLLLMNSEAIAELDVRSIRFFQTRRVDGMLLSVVDETDAELTAAMNQVKVPIVLVDREIAIEGASSVRNDHASGMADAVRHMLDLGHRRIAMIGGSRDAFPGREREKGLRLAVDERDEAIAANIIDGSFSPNHGYETTAALLDGPDAPTAIVCGSNQILVGCLQVINERGIVIGRDLSLVTCDDTPASIVYHPALASISRDTVGLGRSAAELLLHRLRDRAGPETIVLPTRYMPRASVASPPSP
jgi:LacI family transcriptional regulator